MKYRIKDKIVDTNNSEENWSESQYWDGQNNCGTITKSQWHYQHLYRVKSGRYFREQCSRFEGERDSLDELSKKEAALWLMECGHKLPADLQHLESEIAL